MKGGPIIVKGDGTPLRSYLYAADLAIWLWTILVKGQSLRPYNVVSDESLSIEEIAKQVAAQIPGKINVEIRTITKPDKQVERYVPEIQRIIKELGISPLIPINTGIRRSLQFFGG